MMMDLLPIQWSNGRLIGYARIPPDIPPDRAAEWTATVVLMLIEYAKLNDRDLWFRREEWEDDDEPYEGGYYQMTDRHQPSIADFMEQFTNIYSHDR